jgi:hypothetical protein
MSNEKKASLLFGMVRVVVHARKGIQEDRGCFLESHSVFAQVLACLAFRPRELDVTEAVPLHPLFLPYGQRVWLLFDGPALQRGGRSQSSRGLFTSDEQCIEFVASHLAATQCSDWQRTEMRSIVSNWRNTSNEVF